MIEFKKADSMLANGTHLVGEVRIGFKELCAALGRPHYMAPDIPYEVSHEKVRVEWIFTTGRKLKREEAEGVGALGALPWVKWDENGEADEVVTVYDWKEYRMIGLTDEWHIGGHTRGAMEAFRQVMEQKGVRL